ncbi:Myc-associated zinc finger [Mycena venus]|uniref:Myc-associated zinc finger n=1 Tax=Mycena venus TaxID=2733690 RepID=A0A8H7CV54_9AGAR|nr:Myc-associated zinc finger [Mycena venus]
MPAFDCRQCHREFISDEALLQHYKDSPAHPFCLACNKSFDSQDRLDAHNARNHPGFACTTCRQSFATQSSLEDHYRGKVTIHPKCLRCGKGFLDRPAVTEASYRPRLSKSVPAAAKSSSKIARAITPSPPTILPVAFATQASRTTLPVTSTAPLSTQSFGAPYAGVSLATKRNSKATLTPPAHTLSVRGARQALWMTMLLTRVPAHVYLIRRRKTSFPRPQVDFRSSGATANKTEAWKDLSNRNMGGLTAAPMILPQLPASTWSFNPLVEQPDGPSDVKSGPHLPNRTGNNNLPVRSLAVSPPKGHTASQPGTSNGTISEVDRGGLPCMVCRGRCVDPTVTIGCGHVFCKKCVTKRIVEASACPKCAAPTLLYCLFRLHLDD